MMDRVIDYPSEGLTNERELGAGSGASWSCSPCPRIIGYRNNTVVGGRVPRAQSSPAVYLMHASGLAALPPCAATIGLRAQNSFPPTTYSILAVSCARGIWL